MQDRADNFWQFLDAPLRGPARLVLIALVIPLLLSFAAPLWRISMEAPQYPDGLSMDIYSYKLIGGNDGHDVQEINTLNHYIGMHQITREELRDLDWMPFGMVAMALLALRAAALGNVRTMIDLSMIAAYISVVAFGRFLFMLYEFGHDLDPHAPVHVEPFMPVVLGSKKIANFTTHSMPQLGSVLMGVFTVGVWGITLFYLWRGRRDALRVAAAS
ncbi:MAG: hypothetical protein H6835_03555 [Planctomycetes bacterium]|nr:hypothetical protein [Planctomycetota bacterium]